MCDFTITTAIGLIALFNLQGYPDCSPGHPHYGYNDDRQEIVCWGYLPAGLVEVTDLTNSYSVAGQPAAPSPHSCESPSLLPPPATSEEPDWQEFWPDYRSPLG